MATANAGSFTAAADDLGMSTTAISQGVRDLEKYLGRKLFERRARGVVLTMTGRLLLPRATRAIFELALVGQVAGE